MTNPPHLRDPYEDQMVQVCSSSISGSGEGLRVKKDVEPGTIVAYYHGLRYDVMFTNIDIQIKNLYSNWELRG